MTQGERHRPQGHPEGDGHAPARPGQGRRGFGCRVSNHGLGDRLRRPAYLDRRRTAPVSSVQSRSGPPARLPPATAACHRAAVSAAALAAARLPGRRRAHLRRPRPRSASVDIVKVQGIIDPALAGYVRGTIARRREGRIHGDPPDRLGRRVRKPGPATWAAYVRGRERSRSSPGPGPPGARVQGAVALPVLLREPHGDGAGRRPRARRARSTSRSEPTTSSPPRSRANARALDGAGAAASGASPCGVARLVAGQELAAAAALWTAGAVSLVAPDIPTLLQDLDGRTVQVRGTTVTLATLNRPDRPVEVRFHEIGLIARTLHAVSTPVAVYVLLVLGLWGLAFELTQPGLGLAGIGGGVFLAFAHLRADGDPGPLDRHRADRWPAWRMQGLDVLLKRLGVLTFAGTALFAVGSGWAWWGVAPEHRRALVADRAVHGQRIPAVRLRLHRGAPGPRARPLRAGGPGRAGGRGRGAT